jgi:hypothetical protein
MADISLIQCARLLGSTKVGDMAIKVGFTFPPALGTSISVRELVRRVLQPLPPTNLKLFWDVNAAGQIIFHPPDVTGVPLDKTIQFDWSDSADTPGRKAKKFLLDIKVAATSQEFHPPGGLSSPFETGAGFGTTGFEANTRYSWNVVALNDFGRGPSSQTFTFQTVGRTGPPPVKPQISVSSSGSGAGSVFVIIGSGFLPNHDIIIRLADDALTPFPALHQSSDGQGKLNARFGIPCTSRLGLHFTATDGRPDPGNILNQLESNTFDIPCP